MAIETETLYKLMIMHMLNKVEFPLTNTQIAQFFLENEYTNYFAVQKAISELIEDGFVFSNVNRNTSYYHLTSEGRESLKFFENKIPNQVVDDIDMFLVDNKYELRNEVGTISDYYTTLIEVNISTPDRKMASQMCTNWEAMNNSQKIYQFIIDNLTK